MFDDFLQVIFRSIKLDKNLYRDPKTFSGYALYFASLIMILEGMAGAIAISSIYKTNILLSGVTSFISWAVWAVLIYAIGVKLFPEQGTKSNLRQVLITVGLAHSPGLFRFLAITPSLVVPIIFITQFWIFASLIIGIRETLSFKSNFRALGVVVIAFLIISIVSLSFIIEQINSIPVN